MIKHGKVRQQYGKGQKGFTHSHLDPIMKYITKGICDSKQRIVLEPQACDVRGAKKFNPQQCVIAKALQRTMKPQAVAVGRSLAYVVVDGLAIRFRVPAASRKVVEEFDKSGKVKRAPIELREVNPTWRMGRVQVRGTRKSVSAAPRKRMKKIGVRAVGGGISI